MNDKVFNLLEKMYGDLTGKIDGLSTEIRDVKATVEKIDTRLTKLESTIENVTNKKIDVALEGYTASSEKLDELDSKIENMADNVTNIEIITSKNWNDIATLKKAK